MEISVLLTSQFSFQPSSLHMANGDLKQRMYHIFCNDIFIKNCNLRFKEIPNTSFCYSDHDGYTPTPTFKNGKTSYDPVFLRKDRITSPKFQLCYKEFDQLNSVLTADNCLFNNKYLIQQYFPGRI